MVTKTDTDDHIMVAVNARVEEWKASYIMKDNSTRKYSNCQDCI